MIARLSDLAGAGALVAIMAPGLKAAEIRFEAIATSADQYGTSGPGSSRLTRLRINTPDQATARSLAEILRLDPRPVSSEGPDWCGTYPRFDTATRSLHVELIVTPDTTVETITLHEVSVFLDLLAGAAPSNAPAPLVHIQAQGTGSTALIHAVDQVGADVLERELADARLPIRPFVLAPVTNPHVTYVPISAHASF